MFQKVNRFGPAIISVGREVDLQSVNQAFGKVRAGHGQVVALVGDPGVGKSRLFCCT
ncbi:MAG: AAA family ATPase, partial [Deltaproteobacteria bacterium]|nr:AAA family ATPase [Deltaproteobacteria bacterium]